MCCKLQSMCCCVELSLLQAQPCRGWVARAHVLRVARHVLLRGCVLESSVSHCVAYIHTSMQCNAYLLGFKAIQCYLGRLEVDVVLTALTVTATSFVQTVVP
jgi:hypothetical protein